VFLRHLRDFLERRSRKKRLISLTSLKMTPNSCICRCDCCTCPNLLISIILDLFFSFFALLHYSALFSCRLIAMCIRYIRRNWNQRNIRNVFNDIRHVCNTWHVVRVTRLASRITSHDDSLSLSLCARVHRNATIWVKCVSNLVYAIVIYIFHLSLRSKFASSCKNNAKWQRDLRNRLLRRNVVRRKKKDNRI